MAQITLNTKQITDWASFHLVCKEAFGFPEFYGANMDAWIDCLSYLTEDDGMTRFHLSEGEMMNIQVTNVEDFNSRIPNILDSLVECSAFVNNRYLEMNDIPRISLIFL